MGAKGLVEGMAGAFQITTTDNICLVIDEGQARLAARLSGEKPGNKDRQGR